VEADSKQSSAGFLLHLLFESEDEGWLSPNKAALYPQNTALFMTTTVRISNPKKKQQ
jgi:hypothetical protein